ncbi:hypothetical protein C9374_012476 [Naegleria lovaniensis]|uniref:DNA polymerase alpha subunit B n=1 Tax=Naegleria lovaniensis TaxID=51637 RepID=A0AA88H208_NAELO|nr:uncharacterized protein C9374_012476 [Naegleria lovaniensis]KAG2392224.1 hypothetical protein C9374_012476 [Naegleria lovaniensis]
MSKPNDIGSYLTSLFSSKPSTAQDAKKTKPQTKKKTNSTADVSSGRNATTSLLNQHESTSDNNAMMDDDNYITIDRTNQGKTLVEFGDSEIEALPSIESEVKIVKPTKSGSVKYMYDKLHKQSNVLLDRLEEVGSKILEYYGFESSKPLNYYSDQPEIYIGRILSETVGGDDQLNSSSILLEGLANAETSDCKIVKLNFEKFSLESSKAQTLFPGQIVAVKGLMTVQFLRVEKIYTGAPLFHEPQETQKTDNTSNTEKSKLKIMVACGPFTLRHNILYNPLKDLVTLVDAIEPNVLILVGPFLSDDNALVSSTFLEETFDDVFEERVFERLRSIETNCKVILIPSLKDVNSDFVFPQPPLDVMTDNKIQSLSNPCTFTVSASSCNVKIGVTSIDVIKDIKEKEYTFGYVEDQTKHFYKCVLEQGYYYPRMLPTEEIPLDYSLAHGTRTSLKIEDSPDILILPSDQVAHCCTVIDHTLVINPTRLCGNENRKEGSYAIIDVSNDTSLTLDKRIHVQVVNI